MHLTQAMHTSQKSFERPHVHSNGGSGVQRGAVALKGCSPLTVSQSPALAQYSGMAAPFSLNTLMAVLPHGHATQHRGCAGQPRCCIFAAFLASPCATCLFLLTGTRLLVSGVCAEAAGEGSGLRPRRGAAGLQPRAGGSAGQGAGDRVAASPGHAGGRAGSLKVHQGAHMG